jgi:hypothetical protein
MYFVFVYFLQVDMVVSCTMIANIIKNEYLNAMEVDPPWGADKIWTDQEVWCMCDRESYMKMTRCTNLMQQFYLLS